jgi:hypothetical protein
MERLEGATGVSDDRLIGKSANQIPVFQIFAAFLRLGGDRDIRLAAGGLHRIKLSDACNADF